MSEKHHNLSEQMQSVDNAVLTERTFSEYKVILDIHDQELTNWHVIVDLGSGMQQDFAKSLKEEGGNNTVISVDPKLALPEETDLNGIFPEEHEARLRGRKNPQEGTIAALGNNMPLKEASVDAVLAVASVPRYLKSEESIRATFDEIFRILKTNGEARVFPINVLKDKEIVEKILGEWGDKVSFNMIQSEKDKHLYLLKLTKIS